MKLHLLFVLLLAGPLIGRVLSHESTAPGESCEAPKSAEISSAAAAPAGLASPISNPHGSTPAPAAPTTSVRRIPNPPAFTFM